MRRYVRMVLFVADSHLGRLSREENRLVEVDLVHCLRSVRDRLTHLYLVGDVFEHYIEYRHLVPKGAVRLLGTLAELADAGVPITYVLGNHDPWHRDYFETEFGIPVITDEVTAVHFGKRLYVHHGDGFEGGSKAYDLLKPILRHPFPVWIFRTLLPGDLGMWLAKSYSHSYRSDNASEQKAATLRAHARTLLETRDLDAVIMAHTHIADLAAWDCGSYMNPGCWFAQKSVGLLDESGMRICRWNGSELEPLEVSSV